MSLQHLRGYNSTSTIRTHTTNTNDTIFALATGVGRAGVAIIRISGPSTSDIYFSLTRTTKNKPYRNLPPSHKLVVRNIHHPITEELLDSGAGVIYYAFGASYTAETSIQRQVALLGANGAQATRFETLRDQILKSMALVEALIDFSEEDGVEDALMTQVRPKQNEKEDEWKIGDLQGM
uniref:Related to MSS1-mitochondrial GTPase involved in expression of COX1 n=1 Tax=Melanopsichium pennsylvanicum 4 TaxID=1398559 RepID=A0A077R004_9BASI|nr:related to MSS1-mitochondrial GTPase involved in expression of COX1 [Melanopsichium pennsylvanicum 4]